MAPSSNTDEIDLIDDGFASPHPSADADFESGEPPELKLDLQELKDCASTVASATFEIEGARHSCIARLTRREESLAKATSELATMQHVRDNTSIPVPKIFYRDLRPNNPVGAPFVLMQRLPGQDLYSLWDDLPFDHKKDFLTQIASVLTQLAALRFDKIGSLQNNGLGPLVHSSLSPQAKPFKSTLEYLHALLPEIALDFDEYEKLV
ncbi:unnamed protein product [Penicillium bialowiezense]